MKKIYMLLSLALLFGGASLKAQITDLYDFGSNSYPYADVTIAGNKLFGTAYEGGANGYGYFFSVNKDGSGFKDLWDCNDTGTIAGNSNGGYPYGDVTVIKDKLYGFTYEGGAFGYGEIFRIDTNGSGYKDLYDFASATGGNLGWGGLTLIGNKFFGMGTYGGAYDSGMIFSIDTNGTGYKDLFDFNGTNGGYPESVSLAVYKNKLYGMTEEGGVNDSGVIFSIDTNGSGYKDLVDLNYSKGYYPYGFLTLVGNKLFGLTYYGGVHDSGVVFSVDTNGAGYKNLVDMDSATGCFPAGSLTLARNILYGMTDEGGVHDSGIIFSIDTTGKGYQHVYDFGGSTSAIYPYGNNITVATDTLFGMSDEGGINGYGQLFMLKDTALLAAVNNVSIPKGNISIYPNPNNGRFNVLCNVPSISGMIMDVYNVIGEKVYTGSLKNANNQVDLSANSKGVYLYKVITLEGAIVKQGKIILE
ncbi:MAG TPA: T9SS type A sorting domain-containing protein [Bacteroidia bacterium]|jgi:uncharacterized repeat protein (TIGR03803 family)|nr:T9SS type A sorting domain-containing protein [Bacteroidia bacterium]